MKPIDVILILIVAGILAAVLFFIHRSKKKGIQCIGCPDAKKCTGNCSACSGNCSSCNDASRK